MIHTMELMIEQVKPYEIFSNVGDLKQCSSICFQGKYKGINIKYYMTSYTLILGVNVLDIMEKDFVCVSDLTEFKKRIQKLAFEIIGRNDIDFKVNRIDYFVNLPFTTEELDILEKDLLYKHLYRYKYMSVKTIYRTSICPNTKYRTTVVELVR